MGGLREKYGSALAILSLIRGVLLQAVPKEERKKWSELTQEDARYVYDLAMRIVADVAPNYQNEEDDHEDDRSEAGELEPESRQAP